MKKVNWSKYLYSLNKKYSLFYINRKYKSSSFNDENEYLSVQTKLCEEIDELSEELRKEVEDVVHEIYPAVDVLLYDSLLFNRSECFLGKVLVRGVRSDSELIDVRSCFERLTGVKLLFDRFESLSEEIQSLVINRLKLK